MSADSLHSQVEAPLGWCRRTRRGRHRLRLGVGHPDAWPAGADSGEIVDRAWARRNGEPLAQGVSDLPERPAPLAQLADQIRVGFKLAARGPGIGVGEEISDLVIEVHIPVDASTVRLCSGLFGGYSVKFGHIRCAPAPLAEQTRIYPNSVRLCSGLFGAAQAALDILRLKK